MSARPRHLTSENASRFQDQSVVEHYHQRLPYPPEVYETLLSLIVDEPRTVLDVGTGTGEVARPLAAQVERVDAVDISVPMIEKGKQSRGGDHPRLRWLHGRVEDVALLPPYALIVGGDSIHWMDWDVIFARFREMLTPKGSIVLLSRGELPPLWNDEMIALIQRFSLMQNYEYYDLAEELEKRGLFRLAGEKHTAPVSAKQSIEDYIGSTHSRGSLSMDAMRPEAVSEFDARLRDLVMPYSTNGLLTLETTADLQWGK